MFNSSNTIKPLMCDISWTCLNSTLFLRINSLTFFSVFKLSGTVGNAANVVFQSPSANCEYKPFSPLASLRKSSMNNF
ncbi:MAG: hypothetical protein FWH20_11385 [Oscillospiraceae bacterium]|nr:hypothetical protein [Oscillospiraceae bacterium]